MSGSKPFMEPCFLCKEKFLMGGGDYLGNFLKYYRVNVCRGCYRASKKGWGPTAEVKLLARLEELGKPVPERNEHGALPRE